MVSKSYSRAGKVEPTCLALVHSRSFDLMLSSLSTGLVRRICMIKILTMPNSLEEALVETDEMDEPYLPSSATITLPNQSASLLVDTSLLALNFSQHVQLLVFSWAADSAPGLPFCSRTGASRLSTQAVKMSNIRLSNLRNMGTRRN
jgi:hypothetical protein